MSLSIIPRSRGVIVSISKIWPDEKGMGQIYASRRKFESCNHAWQGKRYILFGVPDSVLFENDQFDGE